MSRRDVPEDTVTVGGRAVDRRMFRVVIGRGDIPSRLQVFCSIRTLHPEWRDCVEGSDGAWRMPDVDDAGTPGAAIKGHFPWLQSEGGGKG